MQRIETDRQSKYRFSDREISIEIYRIYTGTRAREICTAEANVGAAVQGGSWQNNYGAQVLNSYEMEIFCKETRF
jgi:hypothetical protein